MCLCVFVSLHVCVCEGCISRIAVVGKSFSVSGGETLSWVATCTKVGTGGNSECQVHPAPGLQISDNPQFDFLLIIIWGQSMII